MSNGKGDTPRPIGVSRETWDTNWNRIFKSKPKKSAKTGKKS